MLPRPDIVFQLDAEEEKMTNREDYGNEIYEKYEFQKRLREEYKFFHTYKYWKVINATREINEVNMEIINEIEKLTFVYNNNENENEEKNNYPNKVNEDLFSIKGLI
jgi:thymidylate kinase